MSPELIALMRKDNARMKSENEAKAADLARRRAKRDADEKADAIRKATNAATGAALTAPLNNSGIRPNAMQLGMSVPQTRSEQLSQQIAELKRAI